MGDNIFSSDPLIKVLELRNYLLEPGMIDKFSSYFDFRFVGAMNKLHGYTLGQFKIADLDDRFVWLRGFANMSERLTFLNDFYVNSPVWKEFGPGANDMMINSDNVYLLRPWDDVGVYASSLQTQKQVTVVDFHICNSTLSRVLNLFRESYLSHLDALGVTNLSVWISEMAENEFPRLPVFQDKNLLVTITNYQDSNEYYEKQNNQALMSAKLKRSMHELITQKYKWILINTAKADDSKLKP